MIYGVLLFGMQSAKSVSNILKSGIKTDTFTHVLLLTDNKLQPKTLRFSQTLIQANLRRSHHP
jgi:hypothetical protein